jgi:hypothetical protein
MNSPADSVEEGLHMNNQEEKQKALFSLASLAVGLKHANHERQTAALEEAREQKVTNSEWLRECVRLKTLDAVTKTTPAESL